MNVVELLCKKRDGYSWSEEELRWFIDQYVQGEILDCQVAAWAMAVYFRGMTLEETTCLTRAMAHSGKVLTWPEGCHPLVDKHSTGGIGDKISLVLAPWLASCGVHVPMVSGRALGPTGGTLDKLESIPGFRTDLSIDEFMQVVADVGCAIVGQTDELVPADRKLYQLRDVTATVPSIPLITASILSKKYAEGIDALVLDVKYGSGAFMKTAQDAQRLADSLCAVARQLGLPTQTVLSDMNQPLGRKVGNALEVQEAIDVLQGKGPDDVRDLARRLAVRALLLAGTVPSEVAAEERLEKTLADGLAWRRFVAMVTAQGGVLEAGLPCAARHEFPAPLGGRIVAMDAEQIGYAVIDLGGGRLRPGEPIDHSVGFEFLAKVGDVVAAGEPVAIVYAPNDQAKLAAALRRLQRAIHIQV